MRTARMTAVVRQRRRSLSRAPASPMDNGTSSWIVAFPGCTGLQAGHKHLAVVRVFSTEEELQLLMDSVEKWDKAGAIPCTTKSSMSEIDLILVYSKDLEADAEAKSIVGAIEAAFHSDVYGWMSCFSNIKSMSANLKPGARRLMTTVATPRTSTGSPAPMPSSRKS